MCEQFKEQRRIGCYNELSSNNIIKELKYELVGPITSTINKSFNTSVEPNIV